MKAIIPAAGYGTRLYPLTKNKPKALLEVKGEPVINHILKKIEEIDEIDEVFIVTNARFFNQFSEWARSFQKKTRIKIKVLNDGTSSEKNRLGAIGDKHFVIKKEKIDDDVLVISSDNLFDFSLKEIHEVFRKKNSPVVGLYDVGSKEKARLYGVVSVDSNGRMTAFQEKPKKPNSTLASTGIYFYTRKSISLLEQYVREGNSLDAPGNFVEWLHKNSEVYGHAPEGKWFDIGSFASLEKARKEFSP